MSISMRLVGVAKFSLASSELAISVSNPVVRAGYFVGCAYRRESR